MNPTRHAPALVLARRGLTVSALVALFIFLRIDLLRESAIWLGWNSDSAIFGLMAKRMRDGTGFDVYFWGQNYLGPLTSALAALLRRALLDPLGLGPEAGPLALRLSSMAQVAFGIAFSFLAIERPFGYAVALLAGMWLAVSPPFLAQFSAVPMGPEMAFALGSVLFFLTADSLTRSPALLDRPAGRFVFGAVAGAGWWVNQTIALVLAPCSVILLLRSRAYAGFLERIQRAAARDGAPLGQGDPPEGHGADVLRALPFAAGFAIGHFPAWPGGLLGWYPRHYMFVTPYFPEAGWLQRLGTFLTTDLRRLFGLENGAAGAAVFGVALLAVAFVLFRHRRKLLSLLLLAPSRHGGIELAASIVAAGAYFFTLTGRTPVQLRYIAPVLPAALALVGAAAFESVDLVRPRLPRLLAGLAACGLALAGLALVERRAAGTVREILAAPDPRPLLREIEARGYAVCHADYWVAYNLQFLSDERVRFVPWHSFDRNRLQSARLREEPGPHCLVLPDGTLRDWTAADAADEGGPARRRRAE
ncbi:MAG TPA: hypothetical protein VGM13_16025 [Thermoanaerobaculia bacterium]|jgi:hypothetical protein